MRGSPFRAGLIVGGSGGFVLMFVFVSFLRPWVVGSVDLILFPCLGTLVAIVLSYLAMRLVRGQLELRGFASPSRIGMLFGFVAGLFVGGFVYGIVAFILYALPLISIQR